MVYIKKTYKVFARLPLDGVSIEETRILTLGTHLSRGTGKSKAFKEAKNIAKQYERAHGPDAEYEVWIETPNGRKINHRDIHTFEG